MLLNFSSENKTKELTHKGAIKLLNTEERTIYNIFYNKYQKSKPSLIDTQTRRCQGES